MDKFFDWINKIIDTVFKNEKLNGLVKKLVNKETVSYIFWGVVTTVVAWGSFWAADRIFTLLGWTFKYDYQVANAISWIISVSVAYVTNKLWVFRSPSFSWKVIRKEIPSFFGARLFCYFLESGGLYVMVTLLSMEKMLSKILISIIVVLLNYLLSKLFVFRKKA